MRFAYQTYYCSDDDCDVPGSAADFCSIDELAAVAYVESQVDRLQDAYADMRLQHVELGLYGDFFDGEGEPMDVKHLGSLDADSMEWEMKR